MKPNPDRNPGGAACCLVQGPSCQLGGACSEAQTCAGGIAGCTSNCLCLGGIWQAPCPAGVPRGGSTCTAAGATCGYLTQASACGGSVDCNCRSGTWSCAPTCVTVVEDAAGLADCVDAGPAPNCTGADIEAKNYDQSCQTNSDCVLVGEGESCYPCSLAYGPYGAISHSDLARFEADVAKTPAGNPPVSCAPSCTPSPSACCVGGKCQVGNQCAKPVPTDAAADTGADACAPSVCEGSCAGNTPTHTVSTLVDGCVVSQCCVPDDAGAEAGLDGGPADAGREQLVAGHSRRAMGHGGRATSMLL